MRVGVLRVKIRLHAARTLKEKRSVIKSLLVRMRRDFNVSAAELELLDDPGGAVLGFAHLADDGRYSDEVLSQVLRRLGGSREYVVEDHQLEIL